MEDLIKIFVELNNNKIDELIDLILKTKVVEEKIKNLLVILNKPDTHIQIIMNNEKLFESFINTKEERLKLYTSYYPQVEKNDINAYNNICKEFLEKTKEKILKFHESNMKLPIDKETLNNILEDDDKNIGELYDENDFYMKLKDIISKEFQNHIDESFDDSVTSRISKKDMIDMFKCYLEHETEKAMKYITPEAKSEKKRKSIKPSENGQQQKKSKVEIPQTTTNSSTNDDVPKKKLNARSASEKAKTRINQGRKLYENNKLDDEDGKLDFLKEDFQI